MRNPKRIVLKSPPHTARIRVLLEMFPKAKFVHIVRDPYVIFPSTVNLWKRLYRDQGLQMPTYEGLDEHVFATFTRMYEAFDRDRELIGPGQFCEIRYEDLIADPVEQMRSSLRATGAGRFRVRAAGDRRVFCRAEGLQDQPLSDDARDACRDHSPLGQVSQAIRLRGEDAGAKGQR